MSVQVKHKNEVEKTSVHERRGRLAAGFALLAFGALSLLADIGTGLPVGRFFLLFLGGIFLIWALVVAEAGLLIPGGILSGLGLGVYLVSGPLETLGSNQTGAVILFSFALGWMMITVLSRLVWERVMGWPLIPGGIMAAIGGALWIGGPALEVLAWIGRIWPLGLVGAGLYLVLNRGR